MDGALSQELTPPPAKREAPSSKRMCGVCRRDEKGKVITYILGYIERTEAVFLNQTL